MVVGLLRLDIRLPEAQSLKERRWILKSLITRVRNRFNVSVAEVDPEDVWQRATVAVAHVGSDQPHTNKLLDQILDLAEGLRQIEVLDSQIEFL